MFEIKDGRPHFFQWDLNQKLIVNCNAKQVHFCNGTSDKSLVVEVKDGMADVPNILLQSAGKIKAYAYVIEDETSEKYTLCTAVFKVCDRSQPDDYAYTETEILTWKDLYNAAEAAKNAAEAAQEIAETKASEAAESALNASRSEENVALSARAAEEQATASENSASAAGLSAAAAKDSEDNAKQSEQAAEDSAEAARLYESNAFDSAASASENANVAVLAAEVASNKAAAASVSEQNASDSARASADNASAAELSSSAAKTSEDNAKKSETEALTSATNAGNSEAAALESANAAKESETNAAKSAAAAANSETAAADSASAAAASMTGAETARQAAEAAVGKTSYIGENGNWFEWDANTNTFVDSGISAAGPAGKDGKDGSPGEKGDPFTYEDFTPAQIEALKVKGDPGKDGEPGQDGQDGYTPVKGVDYFDGKDGEDGVDGADGQSAYAAAVAAGYTGTEAEFNSALVDVPNKANKTELRKTTALSQDNSAQVYVKIGNLGTWGTGYGLSLVMLIGSRSGELVMFSVASDDTAKQAKALRLANVYSKIVSLYYSVSESAVYATMNAWCNNVTVDVMSNSRKVYSPTVAVAGVLPSDAVNVPIQDVGLDADIEALETEINTMTGEAWTFTLEDGSEVTKTVVLK